MAEAADVSRLLLLADEAGEVPLVSALVQDAVVDPAEVAWDRRGRRLVLLVSRFRWEAGDRTRVRSALRVEHVLRLQRQAWPAAGSVLALLAVTAEPGDAGVVLTFAFAAGATLRAEAECVDLVVEDLGDPWPARREPAHG